jgi:hypothetical protein
MNKVLLFRIIMVIVFGATFVILLIMFLKQLS